MDISSIGSKLGYQGLPSAKDIASILAARPSMAELSAKALEATQSNPNATDDAAKSGAAIASGKVDLKPLVTATFPFEDSVAAFERAAEGRASHVKLQIKL